MSIKIKYAYLNHHTWIYRRHFPKDVKVILGTAVLKQTLKTSDPKIARKRVSEVNTEFDQIVATSRTGASALNPIDLKNNPKISEGATPEEIWKDAAQQIRAAIRGEAVRISPVVFSGTKQKVGTDLIKGLAWTYLRKRSSELRWGGYKSVRYSVGLLSSKYGHRAIGSLCREDGKEFLSLIAVLSRMIGKSDRSRGLTLDALVAFSVSHKDYIKPKTQKRIFQQVNHFLDWCVYEGHIDLNPFRTVLLDKKVKPAPYAVPTDKEVTRLLAEDKERIHNVLLFCLLSGMRSGEAAGLLREDVVRKGNLGLFAHIRENSQRALKTCRDIGRAEAEDHRRHQVASGERLMSLVPDIEAFEERAAIIGYDGRLTRREAEDLAAQGQGFRNAEHYWQWLAEYALSRKVP